MFICDTKVFVNEEVMECHNNVFKDLNMARDFSFKMHTMYKCLVITRVVGVDDNTRYIITADNNDVIIETVH